MLDNTQQEVKQKPETLMFLSFLSVIASEKKAKISELSNKVLLMNAEISNLFICGKDEQNEPFIGIENSFIPWFSDIPWTEVAISYKRGYVYFVATEENGNIIMSIGLKIRRKRMLVLVDPTTHKKTDTMNFKVFKASDDHEILLSSKNLKNNIVINIVNDIDDIIDREFSDDPFSFEEHGFVSDFTSIKVK
jgi:hypothetical protein